MKTQVKAVLAAKRSRVTGALSGAGEPAPGSQADKADDKPPLSAEQMEELLTALEARFTNTPEHYNNPAFRQHREGIAFAKVRTCLENDPALARTVYAMHKRGGAPDVLGRAGKSFLFFEAARNPCPASRDCVYDEKAAGQLRESRPTQVFKGSVEGQRAEMGGAGVASEALWRQMQTLGNFNTEKEVCRSLFGKLEPFDVQEWLDSSDIIDANHRCARTALRCGGAIGDVVETSHQAWAHSPLKGWRAVAKGSEV